MWAKCENDRLAYVHVGNPFISSVLFSLTGGRRVLLPEYNAEIILKGLYVISIRGRIRYLDPRRVAPKASAICLR